MSISLEGRGLHRSFGGFKALDGVDIAVEAGQIRGLIGPNGAGKSTLIDVLSGRADNWGGQIYLRGEEVTGLKVHERRRRGLARSFQRTNIFPALAVGTQLTVAARALGNEGLDDVVEALSLGHLLDRPAQQISYGDQRRLDLALALVGRPEVLLLDEPAAGLTVEESLQLAAILRDLVKKWGVTVLIVEHDMEVIFSICDRITVLHLGKVLVDDLPDAIKTNPEVISAYLGSQAP
ncbi:ABC transporter ATP-binding protein [Oceanibacterium hippocampi]|uniref:Lipopolysaccharide export system ATP-binding protein LptB n=1 Tax=Oceanibacterium hippocampi TaxID=745714 RepID=A0A1Y5TUH6_9PROT|nr:ABC transporter ATP-binding protein [Oceanibacterium hippocampi]SLN70452.1 Lipopolysaccharide export system ATP-binding protein LptB [Oceanibacterium hippocampi]